MTDIEKLSKQVSSLDSKVDCLSGEITRLSAMLQERCPFHSERIAYHDLTLYGKPENGKNPGLVGRVAELERWSTVATWGLRSLWGVLVTLITASLVAWFKL